jgi:hypothetical protein
MLTLLYIALVAYLLGLSVWCLYVEKKPLHQLTCVLVAIPLALRLVGVK